MMKCYIKIFYTRRKIIREILFNFPQSWDIRTTRRLFNIIFIICEVLNVTEMHHSSVNFKSVE